MILPNNSLNEKIHTFCVYTNLIFNELEFTDKICCNDILFALESFDEANACLFNEERGFFFNEMLLKFWLLEKVLKFSNSFWNSM